MQTDNFIKDSSQSAPAGAFVVSSLVLLWLVYSGQMTTDYFTAYLIAWVAHGGLAGFRNAQQQIKPPPPAQ